MSKVNPSYLDLLSLTRPCSVASLLFVVNAPTGLLAGEALFDVQQLSALDMRIKTAMLQVQPQLCESVKKLHAHYCRYRPCDQDQACLFLCFCLHRLPAGHLCISVDTHLLSSYANAYSFTVAAPVLTICVVGESFMQII